MVGPVPAETPGKPVGLLLTSEEQTAVEVAIRPLSIMARRIRATAWVGIVFLSLGFLVTLPLASEVQVDPLKVLFPAFFGLATFGLPAWVVLAWKGAAKIPLVTIPEPKLPPAARQLLDGIRTGSVIVRFAPDARPSWNYKVLPLAEARGPFGPLLLSSGPDIARLALWSMFGGGDRHTFLFDAVEWTSTEAQASGPAPEVKPPHWPVKQNRRAETDPVFFWPQERFERLVRQGGELGLSQDHQLYLLEANRLCLESSKPMAAVELDRAVLASLKEKFGPDSEKTWGTKVLRRDYGAVWNVIGPLAAAAEQVYPESQDNPEDQIDP